MERLSEFSLDADNKRMYEARAKAWRKKVEELKNNTQLSYQEEGAIIRYVSPDSYVLNYKLREGIELTEIERNMIMDLDSALTKLPFYNGNLNRTLTFQYEREAKQFYDSLAIGDIYISQQYMSATKRRIYNIDGQVQIYIQNSKKARDLKNFNRMEEEVLYQREEKFVVINKTEAYGKYWILMEEV